MNLNHMAITALTGALVVCSGCIHEPTRAERAASFVSFAEASIDGKSASEFLFARTARVIAVSSVPLGPRLTDNGIMGTAAMIDPAGYFLTAAHCLVSERVDLVFAHAEREFRAKARIVWRGDLEKGGPDLALVHSPNLPLLSFRWTSDLPRRSEAVLAVGQNTTDTGAAVTACIGGRYLGSTPARIASGKALWIEHSAPLHGGDSGGPLVSADGGLLGINVHSKSVLPFLPKRLRGGSVALRPDLAWIRRMIRDDAGRTTATNNPDD